MDIKSHEGCLLNWLQHVLKGRDGLQTNQNLLFFEHHAKHSSFEYSAQTIKGTFQNYY